jgi:sec-independent protein translocase protein TatC
MSGILSKISKARNWLIAVLAVFVALCFPAWLFAPKAMGYLTSLLEGAQVYQTYVGEGLFARLLVMAAMSIVMTAHAAVPALLVKFKAKGAASPFIFGTALFWGGAVFASLVLLPFTVRFLMRAGEAMFVMRVAVFRYLGLCLSLTVLSGVLFLLPLALLGLSRIGVVGAGGLRRMRLRFIMAAVVVMAVITPTQDAVTLLISVAPLLALYELSILLISVSEARSGNGGRRNG